MQNPSESHLLPHSPSPGFPSKERRYPLSPTQLSPFSCRPAPSQTTNPPWINPPADIFHYGRSPEPAKAANTVAGAQLAVSCSHSKRVRRTRLYVCVRLCCQSATPVTLFCCPVDLPGPFVPGLSPCCVCLPSL